MTSRPLLFLRSTGDCNHSGRGGNSGTGPEIPTLYSEEGMRIGWQGLYEEGEVMEWGGRWLLWRRDKMNGR
jgi:hypothetical protein